MKKNTVTSSDVARTAMVSQSAVSRAYSPGASISTETRRRVFEAAEKLGYRPNALARAMISGRSKIIALLVAYLDNHFYPIVLEQLSRSLQAEGYQVLLFMADPGGQDEIVQKMLQFQVDGIIMASATLSSSLARECAKTGTPVVLFNRNVPNLRASSVTSDNREGGRLIGEHLAEAGHKRIAFIAGHEDSSTSRDREAGFIDGLAVQGEKLFARVVGGYTTDGAKAAIRALLSQRTKPDAVFVANDHMAFAVMDVARGEFGLRIPDDLAVVGYDNVPEAAWDAYALTTVAQPLDDMVAATVKVLLAQIDGGQIRTRGVVLPARLVVRATTRPAARRAAATK